MLTEERGQRLQTGGESLATVVSNVTTQTSGINMTETRGF